MSTYEELPSISAESVGRRNGVCLLLLLLMPLMCCLFMVSIASAAESDSVSVPSSRPSPSDNPTLLSPVTVVATAEDGALTGKSVIAGETMEVLPTDNGSINEQLRVLPGIQYAEEARTSLKGGDILPPNLSIAGGKVFQNNFTIDGLDNNSYTDPTFEGSSSQYNLPGHPQALFLDADLVEEVRVYDHNVSAEFGSFTGGVVDARTRDAAPEFGGNLRYRTTSDRWTELHVDKDDEEEFENSRTPSKQPKFEKHDAGITFDLPLAENAGILASYQRLQSSIPLHWLDGEKIDRRRLENFFGKYSRFFPSGDVLRLSVLHAPYDEKRNFKDSVNGDFTLKGENSSATFSLEHPAPLGLLELRGGYRRSESSRRGVPYLYSWEVTASKDWGVDDKSIEGSPGTLRTNQQGMQAAFTFAFDEVATGPFRHRFRIGADRERIETVLERSEDWINGVRAIVDDTTDCFPGDDLCIEDEQFINFRIIYPSGRVGATVDFYSAFVEDTIRLGRLKLRPGLRFSYDDFMRNRNVAPRLAVALDLFGGGRTILVAGRNRYYGKPLLAYKLREMNQPYFQIRTSTASPWLAPRTQLSYRFSELETPRTDENVIGLDQLLWGGVAKLRYIERKGDKEFAREYDAASKSYLLNNNGESRHYQYRLAWERWWSSHYLAINVTYQKTRVSNEDYSETFDLGDLAERIWYDGDVISLADLPRKDFNRPWIGNLVYSAHLPKGFTFTNVTRYRGKYRKLKNTGEDMTLPDGSEVDIYDEVENSESWLFDWKLSWLKEIGRKNAVQLDLEVNNVFDRKIETGEDGSGVYEIGRQIWAGAQIYF